MKIEAVDFFYLSMPVVRDIGDGSQDALLVRVTSDTGLVGWGECEAAPLASIAAWCCPMSHSACKPVSASVLGQRVDSAADIRQITALVRGNSLDLLQDHPYRFVPAYGHASQNPGSPKWFVPGYGYRIPGFGYSSPVTSYTDYYQFGALKPGFYNPNQQLFLSNSYGAPWYIPGSTTNVTNSWPQW